MYAETIVDERLGLASEELGWMPEYHSTDEIDRFASHLRQWERLNDKGEFYFSRNLAPSEHRFIINEQVLCACDAAYWLTGYAHVANEADQNVRFKFRETQRIYFSVISELESKYSAIELIVGKGRQQYVTTITELLVGHRIFFHDDTNALVASADRVRSEEMGKKILFAYDNMPWWLKPKYSRRVETIPGLLEFDTLNSRVSIQHGSTQAKAKGQQRVGLGRGGTRTVWHISEAASFPKAEEQIEAALLRATHAHPKVLGVVESTFAGKTGWFANQYNFAKENRGKPEVRLVPIFFNWPCARELNPTKTWESTHPIPYEWQPQDKILEQIIKAEMFIRTDPLLSKYFGTDWSMPRIQQWWYHCEYTRHEQTGMMATLQQEMCCDDVEAMVSSYDSVFGKETIRNCHANRERAYEVYGIVGQSIESELEPPVDEIDYKLPRIPIRHTSRRGETYLWEIVPLKYSYYEGASGDSAELEAIDNRLFIFKQPNHRRPGVESAHRQEFGLGVDSSTGMGYDFSAMTITQKGVGAVPDVQAAEWRSRVVGHVQIFAFALPLALYFRADPESILSYPKIGIEQIASVGDVCQKEMKRLGYPVGRFFDFGRYDTKQLKSVTNKQGWFTTRWSRPILIGNFVHVVRNGWYVLNSPWTIEDCREFEVHYTASGLEKMEHSSEANDDAIFAGAISTFILHDLDTLADRSKMQCRAPKDTPPPIDVGTHGGVVLNPGSVRKDRRELTLDDMIRGVGDLERYAH